MHLAQLLYLMLPVYLANMAPPFVRFWPGWNPPISVPLLGSHKTVVGFAAGVAVAVAAAFIQSRLRWYGSLLSPSHWLAAGFAAGFGAMAGDSLKSFFKLLGQFFFSKPFRAVFAFILRTVIIVMSFLMFGRNTAPTLATAYQSAIMERQASILKYFFIVFSFYILNFIE